MLGAMILLDSASDSTDIGSLVTSLLSDLQSKAWLAAIPIGVLLVLAVLRKFGVLGSPAAPAPVPVPAPVDASKAASLIDAPK